MKTPYRRTYLALLLCSALLAFSGCSTDPVTAPGDINSGSDTGSTTGDTSITQGDTDPGGADTDLGGVDTNTGVDTDPGGVDTTISDVDGDGISDEDEGASRGRDTDKDGIPDAEDLDSDGDDIPDSVEAGDADPSTPPRDSDGDGTPDFMDEDSDDNGILDLRETAFDTDGNGIEDYRDFDNDGDGILDIEEIVGGGADCNEDGTPDLPGTASAPKNCDPTSRDDYYSEDSDGDTIPDRIERSFDTDGDGFLDRYEQDSDNDTIPDSVEGYGDSDLDGLANYRDPDSDDDGLADDLENALGTDPTLADSDGDGSTDLIEYAAGTDPNDGNDDPRANGDFVFEVPYQDTPNPERDTLLFRTAIRAADLYFAFDTSTTMSQETAAMRNTTTGVPAIITALSCTLTSTACAIDDECGTGEVCGPTGVCAEDPNLKGCLLDLQTGVGSWHHIDSFRNLSSIGPNPVATANAIPSAVDWWVAPIQAGACIADPANCTNTSTLNCARGGIGCPGFRPEAIPIYVQITDANDECHCGTQRSSCGLGGAPARCSIFTTAYTGAELARVGIRFIGLIGEGPAFGNGDATTIAQQIGIASGTVDTLNQPFVYSATDAAVVQSTVQAVRDILSTSPFDVTIQATDLPGDAGDSLQFIERLEVNLTGTGCTGGLITIDTDTPADGFDDAFPGILPRTDVCWDVVVRENTGVQPTREPQVFQALLTVYADGSQVDARTVYFLVPADVTLPPIN